MTGTDKTAGISFHYDGGESVVEVVDHMISRAAALSASDIHIAPDTERLLIRFRLDGLLEDSAIYPRTLHAAMLARIKILAGLRIDEHSVPQDGRFRFKTVEGDFLDVRVSTAPTYHGENAVLRLLAFDANRFTLKGLGCGSRHRADIGELLARPHGMILATGPTGSGKTTLLYTLVRMLDSRTRSIVTIEDPIEYSLPGVSQIPVNHARGITFSNGLRSILRQDPDVIMVGEIRDTDTARIAISAALTGHLVLSTLHTNSAAAALPRLTEMGIEPYLLPSTINAVIAQRLVRRTCSNCRSEYLPNQTVLDRLRRSLPERGHMPGPFLRGIGCTDCTGTGYKGRIGIYEILLMTDEVRERMGRSLDQQSLLSTLRTHAMDAMSVDGIRKAARGLTTVEEVIRVTYG